MQLRISVSSNYSKRHRRLEVAELAQDHTYTISQFIQLMKTDAFDAYYNSEFQAYLKGRRDLSVTADKQVVDNTELDVVNFLDTQLQNVKKHKVVLHDSNAMPSMKVEDHLNDRMGLDMSDFET